MSNQISKGIQLPCFDLEMLNLGKLIALPFKQFLPEGQVLWLYPSQSLPSGFNPEQYYQPEYVTAARNSMEKCTNTPVQISTWASVDSHWHIYSNSKHLLPNIARSTVWNSKALEDLLDRNQVLRLLFLRVYRFAQPCVINTPVQPGTFFWSNADDVITESSQQDTPVVSKSSFEHRKSLLMLGEPYALSQLETLLLQTQGNIDDGLEVKLFNQNIKRLLGWFSDSVIKEFTPAWMNLIATLGNRSKEEDEGKSNYQAGTDFENIVRQSLEFLGFKVDYSHRGGAGGIDIFCSEPYPLVGECKSGKKIPNDTAVQLLNLGTIRLASKEEFSKSVKLIIGPGELTEQLQKAAKVHGMAILNPTSLEKLVKLHYKYPIDLFKLRNYLVDGQADDEVERYIQQTTQLISLRAYIIQLVKSYLENARSEEASIYELHAVYVVSNPPQLLKREEMHDILVELSSPLIGYLGRSKGSDGSDRFYFLRDLVID